MDPARLAFGYGDRDLFEVPSTPSGRAGTRAPHVALRRRTVSVSARDLTGSSNDQIAE
jgi:hypothetical protein